MNRSVQIAWTKIRSLALISAVLCPAGAGAMEVGKEPVVMPGAGIRVIGTAHPEVLKTGAMNLGVNPAQIKTNVEGVPAVEATAEILQTVVPVVTPTDGAQAPIIEGAEGAQKGEAPALESAANVGAAAEADQSEGGIGRIQRASDLSFDARKTEGTQEPTATSATPGKAAIAEGRLGQAAPVAKVEETPKESPYKALTGAWRKVSGIGYADRIEVTAGDSWLRVRDSRGYGYSFSGIDKGEVVAEPWRGNFLAPGGLVTNETTTRFDGAKVESISVRTETHLIAFPNQLVRTRSLEVRDGKLIETSESVLYRKLFFYFGPYNVPTKLNTTNLASPARAKQVAVYERADAPKSAGSGTGSDKATPEASSTGAGATLAGAVGAVMLLASATGQAAAQAQGSGHGLLGAAIGLVLGSLIGYARRDKSSGGEPLFNAARVSFYGLGGGLLGAMLATIVSHPAGAGAIQLHFGLASVLRAGVGFTAGGFLGWDLRSKRGGGDFDFTPLENGAKMLTLGLVGAILGAVSVGLI